MTATLPGSFCESDCYKHDPFPGDQPTIIKFDDKVIVQYVKYRLFNILLFGKG